MAEEFKNKKPDLHGSEMKKPGTFLKTVITPIYKALKAVRFGFLKCRCVHEN